MRSLCPHMGTGAPVWTRRLSPTIFVTLELFELEYYESRTTLCDLAADNDLFTQVDSPGIPFGQVRSVWSLSKT